MGRTTRLDATPRRLSEPKFRKLQKIEKALHKAEAAARRSACRPIDVRPLKAASKVALERKGRKKKQEEKGKPTGNL